MNPNPKVRGIGTVLKHAGQCVYKREKAYWNKMVKGHLLALPLVAAQSLESQVLEDSQSRWRLTIAIRNKQLQINK
jgi:hypothetical protein